MKIEDLQKMVVDFRDVRDWKKFHNPKDLSLSLVLEAAEVLEHFQWKNEEEMAKYVKTHKQEIGIELADVLYWVLLLSNDIEIDITKVFKQKMIENDRKYPIKKVKGNHTKYNKLQP